MSDESAVATTSFKWCGSTPPGTARLEHWSFLTVVLSENRRLSVAIVRVSQFVSVVGRNLVILCLCIWFHLAREYTILKMSPNCCLNHNPLYT